MGPSESRPLWRLIATRISNAGNVAAAASLPLVRKWRSNRVVVVKARLIAAPSVLIAVPNVAAGRILGSNRHSNLNRSRRLTGVQTVGATKFSRNRKRAKIAARDAVMTGRIVAGNAMTAKATVLDAITV